jgi:dTDP-4-dehydrorhamnose reductase
VNRIGGYDPALLKGCPRSMAGPIPPRAGNVSMCSDKLIALLGCNPCQPWPGGADLVPTDTTWHCSRPTRGSFQQIIEKLYHDAVRLAPGS